MSDRADYIEGLRVERENLARRPDSPVVKRRLAEVDAQLGRYSDQPAPATVETAVPGPISKSRARTTKS